jgi:hemolysin III
MSTGFIAPRSTPVPREQTPSEELANAITHGVGLLLAVAGLCVGVVCAALRRDVWIVVSVSVYGAMLCLLYLSSTLYHSFPAGAAKRAWNVLDHSSIYLLIAGTYTPYTLGPLRTQGSWGWSLFGVIWGLAIAGIVFQACFIHRWRALSTVTYLLMGWIVVVAVFPLLRAIGLPGLLWIGAGGLCYTLGVVFYLARHVPFMHAVWHLCVLAGSAVHFLGVLFTVVVRRGA